MTMSETTKMRIGIVFIAVMFYIMCLPGLLTFVSLLDPWYTDTWTFKILSTISFYNYFIK